MAMNVLSLEIWTQSRRSGWLREELLDFKKEASLMYCQEKLQRVEPPSPA